MEDRLYRGFVAGVVGGIAATTLSQLAYFWGLTTLRLMDWAALLIFAHTPPFSMGEQMFSVFIHVAWCGAVGSVFAYFLLRVTSRKIIFKGWMIGTTPYFLIYLLTSLFQTPGTVPTPLATALSNYVTATVFGIVMGYSLKVLDQAVIKQRGPLSILARPAAKRAGGDEDMGRHRTEDEEGENRT